MGERSFWQRTLPKPPLPLRASAMWLILDSVSRAATIQSQEQTRYWSLLCLKYDSFLYFHALGCCRTAKWTCGSNKRRSRLPSVYSGLLWSMLLARGWWTRNEWIPLPFLRSRGPTWPLWSCSWSLLVLTTSFNLITWTPLQWTVWFVLLQNCMPPFCSLSLVMLLVLWTRQASSPSWDERWLSSPVILRWAKPSSKLRSTSARRRSLPLWPCWMCLTLFIICIYYSYGFIL